MFLFIHGQTEWNQDGRTQGSGDSPLTEFGQAQVRKAADALYSRIDLTNTRIISSPLGRALAAAKIVADKVGIGPSEIQVDPAIAEVNFGDWEGLTEYEI